MRGLLAFLIAGALVAAIVLTAKPSNPATGSAGDGPEKGSGNGPGVTALAPVSIVLECEEATSLSATSADGREVMKIREHNEGQLIRFIDIPDGEVEGWLKTCGDKAGELKITAGALPGKAAYEFEAPRDDTYYISLRAKWFDDCGNSVWVKIDDRPFAGIEDKNGEVTPKNYRWAWHQLMETGRPKGTKLAKGKHVLTFNVREDGPWLDQWCISTDATPPVGDAVLKK
jgi:hypothetical protein